MGTNSSTRRVSFESDENENISVVKGIRLSENVINRMREPEVPPKLQHAPPAPPPMAPPLLTPLPLLRPLPPLFDPITSSPPPPPVVEPVALPAPPPPAPPATETVAAPPPPPPQPPKEQVAAPAFGDMAPPSPSPSAAAVAVAAPAYEPVVAPPPPAPAAVEPIILPTSVPPSAPIAPPLLAPCHAAVKAVAALAPSPLAIEPAPLPINQSVASPPVIEPIAPSHVIVPIAPPSVAEPIPPPLPVKEPIIAPPLPKSEPLSSPPVFEPVLIPPPALHPSGNALSLQRAEPFTAPPLPEFTAPCEPVALPPQPPVDPVSLAPAPEPVVVPESISVPPPSPPPPPPAAAAASLKDPRQCLSYQKLLSGRPRGARSPSAAALCRAGEDVLINEESSELGGLLEFNFNGAALRGSSGATAASVFEDAVDRQSPPPYARVFLLKARRTKASLRLPLVRSPFSLAVRSLQKRRGVDEEALRKKITDELFKGLEQDRAKAERELQAWALNELQISGSACFSPVAVKWRLCGGSVRFIWVQPELICIKERLQGADLPPPLLCEPSEQNDSEEEEDVNQIAAAGTIPEKTTEMFSLLRPLFPVHLITTLSRFFLAAAVRRSARGGTGRRVRQGPIQTVLDSSTSEGSMR
ncbi:hypothetical protein EYF80_040403 [Liparis tanakae]|uniref:Uncharacterized protein n=1 Tax=Liparis tanakae TaxID=230148 RepID=A0A4Z2G848_9TELE|nr:hypothetical protein EYF80_040403 [Liparis tanakae]